MNTKVISILAFIFYFCSAQPATLDSNSTEQDASDLELSDGTLPIVYVPSVWPYIWCKNNTAYGHHFDNIREALDEIGYKINIDYVIACYDFPSKSSNLTFSSLFLELFQLENYKKFPDNLLSKDKFTHFSVSYSNLELICTRISHRIYIKDYYVNVPNYILMIFLFGVVCELVRIYFFKDEEDYLFLNTKNFEVFLLYFTSTKNHQKVFFVFTFIQILFFITESLLLANLISIQFGNLKQNSANKACTNGIYMSSKYFSETVQLLNDLVLPVPSNGDANLSDSFYHSLRYINHSETIASLYDYYTIYEHYASIESNILGIKTADLPIHIRMGPYFPQDQKILTQFNIKLMELENGNSMKINKSAYFNATFRPVIQPYIPIHTHNLYIIFFLLICLSFLGALVYFMIRLWLVYLGLVKKNSLCSKDCYIWLKRSLTTNERDLEEKNILKKIREFVYLKSSFSIYSFKTWDNFHFTRLYNKIWTIKRKIPRYKIINSYFKAINNQKNTLTSIKNKLKKIDVELGGATKGLSKFMQTDTVLKTANLVLDAQTNNRRSLGVMPEGEGNINDKLHDLWSKNSYYKITEICFSHMLNNFLQAWMGTNIKFFNLDDFIQTKGNEKYIIATKKQVFDYLPDGLKAKIHADFANFKDKHFNYDTVYEFMNTYEKIILRNMFLEGNFTRVSFLNVQLSNPGYAQKLQKLNLGTNIDYFQILKLIYRDKLAANLASIKKKKKKPQKLKKKLSVKKFQTKKSNYLIPIRLNILLKTQIILFR